MIYDLDTSYCASSHNRRPALSNNGKSLERNGWELLAWAILEQAVDDLALFARWGLIGPRGDCLPWPSTMKQRIKWRGGKWVYVYERVPHNIASCKGPNDHRQLKAWFLSKDANEFCDLIGCRLPAREIFWSTIKHHGGLE